MRTETLPCIWGNPTRVKEQIVPTLCTVTVFMDTWSTAVYTVLLEHQESLAQGQASTDQVAPYGPLRLGPLKWPLCTHHPSLYVFLISFQEEQQIFVKQQEA